MGRQNQVNLPPLPTSGHPPNPPPPDDMDVIVTGMQNAGSAGTSSATGQCGSFPNRGDMAALEDAFTQIQLKPKDFVCEFFDIEVATKRGVVLQYINGNAPGATCMVGMTRIQATDPRKIPIYLSRNIAVIRQHAVASLQRHFRLTLCATGALEKLCPDDYSISFSWASVTEAGRALHPHGRPDLCLAYAGCDQLVAPIWLSKKDPYPTYVVNVNIHLCEASRRSTTVIQKAKEDDALKAEIAKRPQMYKQRMPPQQQQHQQITERTIEDISTRTAARTATDTIETLKRTNPALFEQQYPHLPVGAPPEWNKSGKTPLPDE
jgi:hypothetical protein